MRLCEEFGRLRDFDTVMSSGAALRASCFCLTLLNLDAALVLVLWLNVRAVRLLLEVRTRSVDGPESGDKGRVRSPRLEDYGSFGLEVDGSSQVEEDGDSGLRADGSHRLRGRRVLLGST